MSRDDAKKKLIEIGIAEPTEAQITALLDSVTDETTAEKARADKYKADADRAKELESKVAELENKNLSEEELRQKEREQLEQRVKELTENNLKSEAKAILTKAGIADEDMEALLPGMIADTLENTQARANAYVSAMNKSIENAIKNREKDDLDGTETPGGEGGGDEKTDDVKNAESLSFGGVDKNAQTARDYYK